MTRALPLLVAAVSVLVSTAAAHNYTFEHSAIAGGHDIQTGIHTVKEVGCCS